MDSNLKRKRGDKSDDPKLQEYLSVMGGSSKTRTWANDDDMIRPSADTAPVINEPAQEEEEEIQELPSQSKKARTEKPAMVTKPETSEPMVIDQSGEEENQEAPVNEQHAEPEAESAPVSDADWLRSKTSRLLGLLDEDEQDELEQHKGDLPRDAPSNAAPATSSHRDESPQPEDESRTMAFDGAAPNSTDNDSNSQPALEDPNVDLIRNSARLFLRNLAYDTTNTDLQPIFERFGNIEEVSTACFFVSLNTPQSKWLAGFPACLPERSYDDFPDRDIRCKSR